MFGYVTPNKGELKIKEFDAYKGIYCGLCKEIKKTYGNVPTFFLSYDFVFMALLLLCINGGEETACMERCMVHPLKRRLIIKSDKPFELTAALSVIFIYYKVNDNIADGNILDKIKYGAAKLMLKSAYKKARENHQKVDQIINKKINELNLLEKAKSDNLDSVAATFADMLEGVAYEFATDNPKKKAVGEIAKNIGRWIYILDAYADIEEDIKQGSYNPLLYRFNFEKNEDVFDFKARIKGNVENTLVQSLWAISLAVDFIDNEKYGAIVKNIALTGLFERQGQIFNMGEKDNGSL